MVYGVVPFVGKTLKPYQGLKLATLLKEPADNVGRKNPKTLSGIETCHVPRR